MSCTFRPIQSNNQCIWPFIENRIRFHPNGCFRFTPDMPIITASARFVNRVNRAKCKLLSFRLSLDSAPLRWYNGVMQEHTEHATSPRRARATVAQVAQMRAAYLAAPRRCLQCDTPILPHAGEKIHETMRRRFCSRSCAASYNNGRAVAPKKKAKPRFCAQCGAHVTAPAPDGTRLLCPSCDRDSWQSLPMLRREQASNADIRRHARHILANRPRVCAHCGYALHVETVHLRPLDDFPTDTPLATINDPANLAFLCPNHRWEYTHGLISLDLGVAMPAPAAPAHRPAPPTPRPRPLHTLAHASR